MDIFNKLRSKGYRITSQREKILKVIYEHPLTVDEIYTSLKKKHINIDVASVYRTSELFTRNGIIQEVEFGDGKKRYELINENNHHHHLICESCGLVEDVPVNEKKLLEQVEKQSKFKVERHDLEFFGYCSSCQ